MTYIGAGIDLDHPSRKQRLPGISIAVVAPSSEALAAALKSGAEAGVEGITDPEAVHALVSKLGD